MPLRARIRSQTYRSRICSEITLGEVESCLAGGGRLQGLAKKAGDDHALEHFCLKMYRATSTSIGRPGEDELLEMEQHIAALERGVGPLTRELEPSNTRGIVAAPPDRQRAVVEHFRTGSVSARQACRVLG